MPTFRPVSGHGGVRRAAVRVAAALVPAALLLGPSAVAQAAALHATPANLSAVFGGAQGGDTIYLASGSYPTFAGAVKPSTVTLTPEPGATPSMAINFNGASNVRVDGVTITGATVQGTSKNITIANSAFTGDAVIRTSQMNNNNVVFDGNTHVNISPSGGYEGRITLPARSETNPSGVVIKNSLFRGGYSDGIQNGSNGTQILDNEFVGIHQGDPNVAHTDALQLYGSKNTVIRGNYFHDVEDGIMAPDGTDHEVIEHNVFVTTGNQYAVTLGSDDTSIVRHNTMVVTGLRLQQKSGMPAPKGTVIKDNILPTLLRESGTADQGYNLIAGSGTLSAGDLKGSPTFVGGMSPATYSGYALAGGSAGKANASDSTDRGIAAAGSPAPSDTTPPDTSISGAPTGTTTDNTPTLTFTATEAGSTFACRVDSGTWTACSSPWTTTVLANGSHVLEVRATDASGNTDATPAGVTLTVATASTPPADTTAPDTTITTGPVGATNDNTPTFGFVATEAGSTFECRVDTGAWVACASPRTTAALADGAHSFAVRASDAAGNRDASAAAQMFTVDTTAPRTTIITAPSSVTIGSGAAVVFTANDASARFECRLDQGAWSPCASPYVVGGLTLTSHTVGVRAIDGGGNVESPGAAATWTAAAPPALDPGPGTGAGDAGQGGTSPAQPTPVEVPATPGPPLDESRALPPAAPAPKIDLHAPKSIKIRNGQFRLACGTTCTVRVTAKVDGRTMTVGTGSGAHVRLTTVGRQVVRAAGSRGLAATVRAAAGQSKLSSPSRLRLG